jgi:hypothetical protein
VAKPKKEAKRTFSKVSRRKGSGGNKSKGSARSGRGVAKVGKASKTPKRNGGVPAINALYPVEGLSLPLASELAKIVSPDNRMTPREVESSVLRQLLWARLRRSYRGYAAYGRGRCRLSGA